MTTFGFRERPVGEVVAEDFRRAAVFKRFGIDFCCGGGRTVDASCEAKGVDYDELERELIASSRSRADAAQADPRSWDAGFLADYIVNVHHTYVRQTLPVLVAFSEKVGRVHGPANPDLVEIAGLVEELSGALEAHMKDEEETIFPYLKALASSEAHPEARTEVGDPSSGAERDAIRSAEEEHEHAGELMRRIRTLSHGFTPPEGACNTYRGLFAKLEEFEEDLHRHVHLENHVLFPKALQPEKTPAAS